MEFEKSVSVLDSLYTLRGGLSAISVEYDKARRIDRNYYEKLHTVTDNAGGARHEAPKGTVEYAEWICGDGFKRVLNKRYNDIEEKYIAKPDNFDSVTERKRKVKHNFIKAVCFLFGAILLLTGITWLVLSGFVGGVTGEGGALEGPEDVITLVFMLLVPLALFITATVFFRKGRINLSGYKYEKLKHEKLIEEYEKEVQLENDRVQRERGTILNYINSLPQIKEDAQEVLNARNAALLPMVQSCNVFYKALVSQFNYILDERDWQHLDLVIYELETRRADSVKEALQLVDRELQTERIARTIGEAAKAICYTLQRNFTDLQQGINTCAVSLKTNVQNMQIAGISGQLTCLTDSVNVGKALQAKSGVTSSQLLSDANAMRYYS